MKDYSFSASGHGMMKYFSKNGIMYFILMKSKLEETLDRAFMQAYPDGEGRPESTRKVLRTIFYDTVTAGSNKELSKFFIDAYLSSDEYRRNACIGVDNFGSTHIRYEAELLIDLLYCICKNDGELEAIISQYEDPELNILNIYKQSSGVKKFFGSQSKSHLWSLPLVQLASYVAHNQGITLKLKNGSFVQIGNGVEEGQFDQYMLVYKMNMRRFFFNTD